MLWKTGPKFLRYFDICEYMYITALLFTLCLIKLSLRYRFLARDVIYTSRVYATMSVSVCLAVTEVHWRIIANGNLYFTTKW